MRVSCFLALFLCTAVRFANAQDTEAAVKSKVMALEQLWNQAYKSGDTKALDSILDDQVVLVNDDGSVQSKAEFLASVKAPPPGTAQQQQVSPESFSVHVYGNVALATGVMRVKGVENGKAFNRRERFIDTWIFKHGNWVCVGTDATPIVH